MLAAASPENDNFVMRLRAKTGDNTAYSETVREYLQSFDMDKRNLANTTDAEELRRTNAQSITNKYYNLATDFYEYGWGSSFHFARMFKDSPFAVNIARHEAYLAVQLGLRPGMKVLDVGCGVGGPLREIAKLTDAHIVGLNNNKYQAERILNERAGLGSRTSVCEGDFCHMKFANDSFDAVYQIEATCHSPRLEMAYAEIFRVLKPGGLFASYEWCTTDKYDESNLEIKRVLHLLEEGNSISKLYTTAQCVQALKSVGFEIIETRDLAEADMNADGIYPWYQPLVNHSSSILVRTSVGRLFFSATISLMETLGIAPTGTRKVQALLSSAGDNVVKAGQLDTATGKTQWEHPSTTAHAINNGLPEYAHVGRTLSLNVQTAPDHDSSLRLTRTVSLAAGPPPALPPRWISQVSPDGKRFYVNTATGVSQWEPPKLASPAAVLASPPTVLASPATASARRVDSLTMSTKGVKLSYLNFLVGVWGYGVLQGKSTTDVCSGFVIPWTKATQLSVTEQLAASQNPSESSAVGEAQWFISHAWKYMFLDVVDAINQFFATEKLYERMESGEDPIIWFDLFTNSQHGTANRPFEWWTTTFTQAVGKMKNVVMVTLPWDNPVTLTRAWCGFEVYATKSTGAQFHVAMTREEMSKFAAHAADFSKDGGGAARTLFKVDIAKSEATNPKDLENILRVVNEQLGTRGKGGTAKLDRLVKSAITDWMVRALNVLIRTSTDKNQLAGFYEFQGHLLSSDGKNVEAITALQKGLPLIQNRYGFFSPGALGCMNKLGATYCMEDRLREADAMFMHWLGNCESTYGPGSKQALQLTMHWGNALMISHEYQRCESLLMKASSTAQECYGAYDSVTIQANLSLALLFVCLERLDEAIAMFTQVWKMENTAKTIVKGVSKISIFGKSLDQGTTIYGAFTFTDKMIAYCKFLKGEYSAALPVLQDWLIAASKSQGEALLLTGRAAYGLCLFYLGNIKDALDVLSDETGLEASWMSHMYDVPIAYAMVLQRAGRSEEALAILQEPMAKPTHVSRLRFLVLMKQTLCFVYKDLGRDEKFQAAVKDLDSSLLKVYGNGAKRLDFMKPVVALVWPAVNKPLPDGWIWQLSDDCRPFYVYTVTGVTQWSHP
ncbi:Delta(24)-sterol C-methyltransferase [Entophlyctis luteolus]|nr:Delta(24)-sterol C-methyltransferase [Entophlyctis luteolus]